MNNKDKERVVGEIYDRIKKVSFQGEDYDSKRELQRYLVLKDAESKGIIQNLQKQYKY